MLKLSIIIPVYNVEKYVGKCIESCLNQDLPKDEYEIVVINDGTQDNSVKVIESYVKPENNIRIIHRENGGLSAARNTGLSEAQGEYVWFVDSDDWIEPNVLQKLLDRVYRGNLDVLCFNLQLAFPDGNKKIYRVGYEENGKVYHGTDFICSVGMPPAAWAALYRRNYLTTRALKFYENILHEDQEFTPRAYCLAERIAFIDDVIYNYNQREGGIMKSMQNERKCKDLLTVADSLYDFATNRLKQKTPAYDAILNKVAFAFTQSLANYQPEYMSLSSYTTKPYYPLYIGAKFDKKSKLKYRLANLSIRLYLRIYKMK